MKKFILMDGSDYRNINNTVPGLLLFLIYI